jgi:hypothetical protein
MTTMPVDFEQIKHTGIQYPQQWTPMEFTCPGCATRCRLDVEFIPGPYAAQEYAHTCGKDPGRCLPGPPIALWEQHGNKWTLVNRFR